MSNHLEDDQLAALVAADRSTHAPPDLAALRAGGRRRLLRQRLVVGAGALAVVGVIAVPLALLGGDGSVPSPAPAPPSVSDTSSPTPNTSTQLPRPQRGTVPLPGGMDLVGEWEEGTIVGEPLQIRLLAKLPEILYAVTNTSGGIEVRRGVRDGDRVLRTGFVANPADIEAPDGIALYDGARVDGYAELAPHYLLLGAVRGEVAVTILDQDGNANPASGQSTTMLPGYTVFFDEAAWNDDWDPLKIAPLILSTDDGRSVAVRERSYVS